MKATTLFLGMALLCLRLVAAPAVPVDVVYKPTFLAGDDSWTAGTGYVAKIGDDCVFLTAHHLFGPDGGLEEDLSPVEARKLFTGLSARSMDDETKVLPSSEILLIPSAKAFDEQGATRDVAAFCLPGYQGAFLVVAKNAPQPGDTVYLLGCPRGEEKLRLIPAKVRRAAANVLEYSFEETGINFGGTSGAPLLNEDGELVGMNIGGRNAGGKTRGFGNPAASFAALVAEALHAKR